MFQYKIAIPSFNIHKKYINISAEMFRTHFYISMAPSNIWAKIMRPVYRFCNRIYNIIFSMCGIFYATTPRITRAGCARFQYRRKYVRVRAYKYIINAHVSTVKNQMEIKK